jgi:NhaA family Na+:H+ antiporter
VNRKRPAGEANTQLPAAFFDRWRQPFARFLRIEAAGGGALLLATLLALVLSNSPWAPWFLDLWETRVGLGFGSLEFSRSLRDWINDALMTLFFFMVALELKRELVLGELRSPRMAALSIAGALGGMLVPAVFYLALQLGQPGQSGWGIVMATDTAFVIGCLALLGPRVPQSLRIFMLSLAIVDDIGAILVVAIGYSHGFDGIMLALGGLGLVLVRAMALGGMRHLLGYFLIGSGIWLAVDASGIHPTITGVALGLLTPARRWVGDERLYGILSRVIAHPAGDHGSGDTKDRHTLQLAEVAVRESLSPVERLGMALHPWVGFVIMPLFALANAGVSLSLTALGDSVTLAVVVGFVCGKPAGILLFSWLAVRTGLALRPPELGWRLLTGGALLAGIGFTMALFIANLALSGSVLDSAKLGVFLASLVAALAGSTLLMGTSVGQRRPDAG